MAPPRKRVICVALLLLTLVCFGHVVRCDVIFLDDPIYVMNNPHVTGGLTAANVEWAFRGLHETGLWIPVTWLSLQLDATVFGPNRTFGFHLTNLLLYAVGVVLSFLVLDALTGERWCSAVAAALFAVHPLRVESVAWITERKDMLAAVFLWLTLAAYHRYAKNPSWRAYGLVCLAFLLGLMCKPTLVTLPFALMLLDYWPLGRLRLGQDLPPAHTELAEVSRRHLLLEKAPLLALSVAISVTTLVLSSESGAVTQVPLSHRLSVMIWSYAAYLGNTIRPIDLAILYPYQVPSLEQVLLALGVLLTITAGVVWQGKQVPALMIGWFWFLGTLIPNSGMVQSGPQARGDRFTLIPHLGLMIAIVWGISALPAWNKVSLKVRAILVGSLVAALGALTWIQTCYWKNSETLFDHSLRVAGPSFMLHYNFGTYWQLRGELENAERQYAGAVDAEPNKADGRLAYGNVLLLQAKNTEAVEQLQRCLELDANNAVAHFYLARALMNLQQFARARVHLERALEHESRLSDGAPNERVRKATVYQLLGGIHLRGHEPQIALGYFRQAETLAPELAERLDFVVALAVGRLGRWSEAETRLLRATARDPDNQLYPGYLAFSYSQQNKKDLAAQAYDEVRARFPFWLKNTNDAAVKSVTRAASFDQKFAEELALQTCEATKYQDVPSLEVLAATQAAAKDFASATKTLGAALNLSSDPALTKHLRDRLRLYESGQALPVEKDTIP